MKYDGLKETNLECKKVINLQKEELNRCDYYYSQFNITKNKSCQQAIELALLKIVMSFQIRLNLTIVKDGNEMRSIQI